MKYENNKIVYDCGDWVMPTEKAAHWNRNNSFPCRIREINGDYADCNDRSNSCFVGNLRLATQEEIDAATKEEKIMVDSCEVKFIWYDIQSTADSEPCTEINVGCVTIRKKLFLKIGKRAGWL